MKRIILLLSMMVFIFMATSVYGEEIIVTISPDTSDSKLKKIKVEPEVVALKFKSNNTDTIRWETEGFEDENIEFFVIFRKNGTPFDGKDFGRGEGLSDSSGDVKVDPTPSGEGGVKRYDYLVVVPGYKPLDPGVLIWD